jgi:hypothetical protein
VVVSSSPEDLHTECTSDHCDVRSDPGLNSDAYQIRLRASPPLFPTHHPLLYGSRLCPPTTFISEHHSMPPVSVFAAGNTALITGGASGIGLAVAQICRKHAMKVALVDNNADFLARAKTTLANGKDSEVETYQLDVSKVEQWKELKDKVQKKFGAVDFLMLNAGIGAKGTWGDTDYFHKVSESSTNADRHLDADVRGVTDLRYQLLWSG